MTKNKFQKSENRKLVKTQCFKNWQDKMSRSATIPGPLDGEQNYQKQFQELVKKWDESKNDPAHFDATEILTEMADILEKVRSVDS